MEINNLYNILFREIEKNRNNTVFEIPDEKKISYKDFENIINTIYINLKINKSNLVIESALKRVSL